MKFCSPEDAGLQWVTAGLLCAARLEGEYSVISMKDNTKPNLNDYAEVIRAVEFQTMEAVIHVDTSEDGIGEIHIIPREQGHMAPVCEEIVFSPVNGNDCQILQFLAEHAAHWYAKAMAEEAIEEKKPAAIMNGNGVTEEFKKFVLR